MSIRRNQMGRRFGALAAALLAAGAIAACGDSDDGGDEAAKGASASAADIDGARAVADPYLEVPDKIGTDVPLSRKPDSDKFVAVVSCKLPPCQTHLNSMIAAAKELGWRTKKITFDATPEDILAKMEHAISLDPDGIIVAGQERAPFDAAMPKAIEKGIPIVSQSAPVEVEEPIIASQPATKDFVQMGEILGNWIVADSEGKANALIFNLANFAIIEANVNSIVETMEAKCPDCKTKTITVQASDIGTTLPSQIASELQRNPEADYVVLPDSVMATGLPAQLREAGMLDRARIVGNNVSPESLAAIKEGAEYGYLQYSAKYFGWQAIDLLARHFNGDEIVHHQQPLQIVTKDTIDGRSDEEVLYELPPDYQEQFKALWQLP